ncbi:hypothetical protein [Yoonia sediminilitoris]|uniref:OmpA-like domain-containing protein n=1 Tax=Yoonia sediminilitoris TaxID=1286148 RepID=A0A2T6KPI6_9RHOB|nr:hypothetical protein [Yoonia sediminilitoris]PUB18486.1 hypothetical protein C8N45_10170 [Yoonia sediminilitoris]RCW98654.1 hypothetical protein DFP92_10170 [Yoonia sediminilitoris]
MEKEKDLLDAFGEIAPSVCNNSQDEHRINRRVEVWIQNGT